MILLSFDIEEFDMPFEYGKDISFADQIDISRRGTEIILNLLAKHHVKATFFSTVIFAQEVPELIERIVNEGHELASHGWFHSEFKPEHLLQSKQELERLSGLPVTGFRMPRMQPVDEAEVHKAGYVYNSSINPTWLPGRYNNLNRPRRYFKQAGVLQIPASVSPLIRFPLFWLSFHNLPPFIYRSLCARAHAQDGYLNIYFHPWEFTNLHDKERFNFPGYVSTNSGNAMAQRMDQFIAWAKSKRLPFARLRDLASSALSTHK